MIKLIPLTSSEYHKIRKCMINDVISLLIETGRANHTNAKQMAEREQDDVLPLGINTKDHYLFSIVNDNNRQCGYIWFGKEKKAYGDIAFIFDLHIYEEFQGKGIGFRTMQNIEEKINELGYSRIELATLISNENAINLYEKCGYKQIRGNNFVITMQKNIE